MASYGNFTIPFTASRPKEDLVMGSDTIDAGSTGDEFSNFLLVLPNNYRILRLCDINVQSTGAIATLPAFADGERVHVRIVRGGQTQSTQISSKAMSFGGEGAAATGVQWRFNAHSGFSCMPDLYPSDEIHFDIPPIDDGGVPTADIFWRLLFRILER